MKEEIARNALIKSGVFTELEEVTKLKNQLALDARVIAFGGKKKTEPPRESWRLNFLRKR
ncbi:hypothetical protein AC45_4987 [Escherichia coli 2-210-07_S3_C3]|nr:hypothetical protein AC45_4987 [Escherichia coli 2-210-07_S3_C3]